MGFREIRQNFQVNAKRGGIIRFTGTDGTVHECRILSAKNGRIHAVSVKDNVRRELHPTLNMEYI